MNIKRYFYIKIMSDKIETKIKWRIENERILKSWCDKSICYQIMHDRAHKRYWCLNAWFAIPVIIISTITGIFKSLRSFPGPIPDS